MKRKKEHEGSDETIRHESCEAVAALWRRGRNPLWGWYFLTLITQGSSLTRNPSWRNPVGIRRSRQSSDHGPQSVDWTAENKARPHPGPLPRGPRGEGGARRRFFELFDLETGFVHLETSIVALYSVKGRPARFLKSCLGGLAAPNSDEAGLAAPNSDEAAQTM